MAKSVIKNEQNIRRIFPSQMGMRHLTPWGFGGLGFRGFVESGLVVLLSLLGRRANAESLAKHSL